jgi:hypothetical protein
MCVHVYPVGAYIHTYIRTYIRTCKHIQHQTLVHIRTVGICRHKHIFTHTHLITARVYMYISHMYTQRVYARLTHTCARIHIYTVYIHITVYTSINAVKPRNMIQPIHTRIQAKHENAEKHYNMHMQICVRLEYAGTYADMHARTHQCKHACMYVYMYAYTST